jgi:hypothetical protein
MLAPYVWPCRFSLDLAILQQAASHILGTHDFTSFAANDPDQATRNAAHLKTIEYKSPDTTDSPHPNQSQPNERDVISTEAAHGLIVSRVVEKSAFLPTPLPSQRIAFVFCCSLRIHSNRHPPPRHLYLPICQYFVTS